MCGAGGVQLDEVVFSLPCFLCLPFKTDQDQMDFVDDFMLHQIDMLHVNTNMTFYFILAQPEFCTDALPHNSVSLNGLPAFKTSLRFLLQFIIFIAINGTTSLLLKMLNYPHT